MTVFLPDCVAAAEGTSKPIYLVKLAKGQEIDIRMRAYKVSPVFDLLRHLSILADLVTLLYLSLLLL